MFDNDRKYTAPWQSGITGIGYNRKVVGELNSMEQLFDPKYKGKVTFLSDARDSTSLVMLMDGVKPEEAELDEVMAAIDKIDEANDAGQIRRFTGNDYTTDLTKGNVVIAMAYAADLIQLKPDNPDLDFAVPEEGARALVGQHDDPGQGRASVRRRGVDELRLRAGGRREDHRLRRLDQPGRRHPGAGRQDRARPRREPARVPGRRDAGAALGLPRPARPPTSGR